VAHAVDYDAEPNDDVGLVVRLAGAPEVEYRAVVAAVGSADADFAVLEVIDERFQEPTSWPDWAQVVRSSPEQVSGCWAIGFPAFKVRPATASRSARRESIEVFGAIAPGSNLTSGQLELRVTAAPRPLDSALPESQWQGISGAAVLASDPYRGYVVVGVVALHVPAEGESSLTVVPVSVLKELLLGSAHESLILLGRQLGLDNPERWIELPRPVAVAPRAFYGSIIEKNFSRTAVLYERDTELTELIEFAKYPDPARPNYLWLLGKPWAGKTALAAHLARSCGAAVDVVAYFLSRRVADASSDQFLAAIGAQLAALLEEPTPVLDARQALVVDGLWQRVISRADNQRRPLLVIVDGLDEDVWQLGPRTRSVASLLPAARSRYLRVVVTSRNLLDLPQDVEVEHPLRQAIQRDLAPSSYAREIELRATNELSLILDGEVDDVAYECVGVLAAAGGRLRATDLAELVADGTGVPSQQLRRTVAGLVERGPLSRLLEVATTATGRSYSFAHGALLEQARAYMADHDELIRHRETLGAWSRRYQTAGWRANTPDYLFSAYPEMLSALGDARLVELMKDLSFIAAALSRGFVGSLAATARSQRSRRPGDRELQAISRCIDLQLSRFCDPELLLDPQAALRQLCLQARSLDDPVADKIARQLRDAAPPQLLPVWVAGRTADGLIGRQSLAASARAAAISADGRRALIGGSANSLLTDEFSLGLIDLTTEPASVLPLLGRPENVRALAMTADGRRALTGGPRVVWWDLDSGYGTELPTGEADPVVQPVLSVLLTPDGTHALVGGGANPEERSDDETGYLLWYDLQNPAAEPIQVPGITSVVHAIAGSADGTRAFASCGPRAAGEHVVLALSSDTPRIEYRTSAVPFATCLALTPDGRHALSGTGPEAGFSLLYEPPKFFWWDFTTDEPTVEQLDGPNQGLVTMAITPDGRHAITSGSDSDHHRAKLFLWDLSTSPPRAAAWMQPDLSVTAIAVTSDGTHALFASTDPLEAGELERWDLRLAMATAFVQPPLPADRLAMSADGRRLIVGNAARDSGDLHMWDVADLAHPSVTMTMREKPYSPVQDVAVTPDGSHVLAVCGEPGALGWEHEVVLWNLSADIPSTRRLSLESIRDPNAIALSDNAAQAWVSSGDTLGAGTLEQWDLRAGLRSWSVDTPRGIGAIALHPDGQHALAVCGYGELLLWNLKSDPPTAQALPWEGQDNYELSTVAISADGRYALTGGEDYRSGFMLLWELEANSPTATPLGATKEPVRSVAISPDGRYAMSAGGNRYSRSTPGEVICWDLATRRRAATYYLDRPQTSIGIARRDDYLLIASGGPAGLTIWTM
jgi:WD40 repeat protein